MASASNFQYDSTKEVDPEGQKESCLLQEAI